MRRLLRILSIAGLCIAGATQAMAELSLLPGSKQSLPSGYEFQLWVNQDYNRLTQSNCPGGDINKAPLALHFNGNKGEYPTSYTTGVNQQNDLGDKLAKLCVLLVEVDTIGGGLSGTGFTTGANSPIPEQWFAQGAKNIHDAIEKILGFAGNNRDYFYIGSSSGALFGAKLIDQYAVSDTVIARMKRAIWLAGPQGYDLRDSCYYSGVGSLVRGIFPMHFGINCVGQPGTLDRAVSDPKGTILFQHGERFGDFVNAGKKIYITAGTNDDIYADPSSGTLIVNGLKVNGETYVDAFLRGLTGGVAQANAACPKSVPAVIGQTSCWFEVTTADHGAWDPRRIIPHICQMIAYDRNIAPGNRGPDC
jgi:hypothetical protein